MNRLICAALLAIVLTGCATSGVEVKANQVEQFQKGKTTFAQVVAVLGQPTSVTSNGDGTKIISYAFTNAQATAASFIPFFGLAVGGVDYRVTMAHLTFDAAGVLKDTQHSATQGFHGLGGATPTPAKPN